MFQVKIKIPLRQVLLLVSVFLLTRTAMGQNNPDRLSYIDKYKDIAIREMERAGIPASIKLAQGILESNSGKSTLARKANNHFGMKCGSVWKGKTYYREDDDYDDYGNLLKSCFRVYKNSEASYIAHSEFLRDPRKAYRYGFLFNLSGTDYKRWALGLKKAGYATNPRYPDLLIGLIEDYELYIYDNMSINETVPIPPDAPIVSDVDFIEVNTIPTALANEGDLVIDIANEAGVAVSRILRYNEGLKNPSQKLEKDYRVFLKPKRSSFLGQRKYHYVRAGQSLFDISQLYGVKLKKLYKKNRLENGTEPAIGAKIKLRGWRVNKADAPAVRKPGENSLPPTTIPVQDLDQDTELDFDTNVPSTSIDDFEKPKVDTSTGTTTGNNNTTNPTTNTGTGGGVKPDTNTSTDNTTNPSTETDSSNYYTVKAGDTLYRLSKRFGVSVPKLKEWNGLNSNLIAVGQRLRIK